MCCHSLKDRAFASDAAESLKLDAKELLRLKIDRIIPEPVGGARDWDEIAKSISFALNEEISVLENSDDLPARRYEKYRVMGQFIPPNLSQG